jgi:hypothetical protein
MYLEAGTYKITVGKRVKPLMEDQVEMVEIRNLMDLLHQVVVVVQIGCYGFKRRFRWWEPTIHNQITTNPQQYILF